MSYRLFELQQANSASESLVHGKCGGRSLSPSKYKILRLGARVPHKVRLGARASREVPGHLVKYD